MGVAKVLDAEIKHEDEQYEQAKEIKAFLKKGAFTLVEADGDVNLALERKLGDRAVRNIPTNQPISPSPSRTSWARQASPFTAVRRLAKIIATSLATSGLGPVQRKRTA